MAAPELDQDHYDVVVIGTGLAESIAAAALAKAGKTVLHLDPNEYYAASQASLTLDELVNWSKEYEVPSAPSSSSSSRIQYSKATVSPLTSGLEHDRRRYALSLFPSVLPSRGELIDTLIKSDVSKYVSFRMLDSVSIWEGDTEGQGRLRRVPGSKEEVFKDKSVSLMEKRRLMKFLMFAGGEFEEDDLLKGKEDIPLKQVLEETFSLPTHLSSSVLYAIAHCSSPDDLTLPSLLRTRRYLRSVGRYGSGAFLVGQYGGAGEVAQGFCRACAVFGGTYILGPSSRPTSFDIKGEAVSLELPCHPRPITTSYIISNPSHLPNEYEPKGESNTIARCIAVLDSLPELLRRPKAEGEDDEEVKKEEDDTAVIIFPPSRQGGEVVRAFMMGDGTGSCPSGQFTLYLSTSADASSDPKEILQPYLHRLSPQPLFESYHLSHHYSCNTADIASPSPIIVLEPYAGPETLTEGLDWEAEQGKKAFGAVMKSEDAGKEFFEKSPEDDEMEGEDEVL